MDELWECSVCTYKNRTEAFKCQICDTRKGTSTRKPRVTPTIVAQQIASSFPPIPPSLLTPSNKYTKVINRKRKSSSSNQNKVTIDHSSGEKLEITVDGVTVVITDYAINSKPEYDDQILESEGKRSNDVGTSSNDV